MSDIGLQFPLWLSAALLALQYWYVLAPAGLACGAFAWLGRGLPAPFRVVAGIAAGSCATPFVLLLALVVVGGIGDGLRAARSRALQQTLAHDETIAGFALPAGARLEYSDEAHRELRSVALPHPASISGIRLDGLLEPITQREWSGTLVADQTIGGWPCRAGPVWFTADGIVTRCALAAAHRLADYDLPAGAQYSLNLSTGGMEIQLAQDGPGLRIAALDADLPPGGSLVLAADGALRRLYVPHETGMTISGVRVYDHVLIEGKTLTAELAEPMQVGGAPLSVDQVVRLDLATGKVEATTRSPILDP